MVKPFRKPRRPAMLDPQQAEEIEGAPDIAEGSSLAHTTAQMFIGTGGTRYERKLLLDAIRREGIDIVSELWLNSPATTLPGVLWRLYLLSQWYERDRDTVLRRYDEGLNAPIIIGMDTPPALSADNFFDRISALFAMEKSVDLHKLLSDAVRVLRVLASGATFGSLWIIRDEDELAYEVTRRGKALLVTADEFEESIFELQRGKLD